jgi:MFS family permease
MAQASESRSWSLSAYGRLLRENRDFRLLWTAQIVSEIGDWFYTVALYSLLLELTGSASAIGLAVVLQLLPQVFAAPLAGVLNDRLPRRAVMIFADVCRAVIVLSMLLVRSADMVWLVWVLLFLETLMWALFEPGRSALIPRLARSDEERLVANALSSTTWAFNLAVGAGLGGLVAYAFGRQPVFILNALSFVGSALLLAAMRVRETHGDNLPPFRVVDLIDFKPIVEGVRYVLRDGRRGATLLVKVGMGMLGAHWVILPIFAERVFPMAVHLPGAQAHTTGAGTLSMSLLFGSRGVGAIAGSYFAGAWARNSESRMRTGIAFGFFLVACSYVGLSLAPTIWLACLAVALGHAGTSIAWVFSTTILQGLTEDRFRGRVFSADFAGLFLSMSAVSFLGGRLVDQGVSVRVIAFATGAIALLPAVLWIRAQPYFRSCDVIKQTGAE